jgi:hypothetical protein
MTCDICGQETRTKWFGLMADRCGQYTHEGRLVWCHDACVRDQATDKGNLDRFNGRWP